MLFIYLFIKTLFGGHEFKYSRVSYYYYHYNSFNVVKEISQMPQKNEILEKKKLIEYITFFLSCK